MEDLIEAKVCIKCGNELPNTKEYFDGGKKLKGSCKKCRRKRINEYRSNQRKLAEANGQKYVRGDCDKSKARKYRQEHKEEIKEKRKEYYEKNKKEYKKYYVENKESIIQYRIDNANKIIECSKKYRAENSQKIADRDRRYKENNREYFTNAAQKRRAMKEKLLSDFTIEQWETCLIYFDNKDAYTGLTMNIPSQDHVIPLSRGGDYTISNIIPCERSINSSKGNKEMIAWFREQDFYDPEREKKIFKYIKEVSKD